MRILVLDDDREFLELVARFLRKNSSIAEVLTAVSITEAEHLARGFDIRVFVIDERLGEDSGTAFIESARQKNPGARFLHFTSDERWEVAAEALRKGADGVLRKSSWTDLLIEAVRRVGAGTVYIDPGYCSQIVSSLRAGSAGIQPVLRKVLTEAEFTVLEGMARGESNGTIAARRGVNKDTVKHQAGSVYEKLGVDDRRQAVAEARRRGII